MCQAARKPLGALSSACGAALLSGFPGYGGEKLFFHMGEEPARANALTYLEVPDDPERISRDLFYLRNLYSEEYAWYPDPALEERQIFGTVGYVRWGVSAETAACLGIPELDPSGFLHRVFWGSIRNQYLFLYVYLLHQKYVLFQFLTDISTFSRHDLAALKLYKERLLEFNADYVFSRITDVPQYQLTYERIAEAFRLKELYADVDEPLKTLEELQSGKEKEEEEAREEVLNQALIMLSMLAIFSALVDSFDFIREFFQAYGAKMPAEQLQSVIGAVQLFIILVIFVIGGNAIRVIWKTRKK